mmetsp:Transcript_37948/g.60111  ORF Transcript_37948/g.60111 Transcript_37948/m.60111 type:complete len:81 (-) Transcript_37948:74-316(-)
MKSYDEAFRVCRKQSYQSRSRHLPPSLSGARWITMSFEFRCAILQKSLLLFRDGCIWLRADEYSCEKLVYDDSEHPFGMF